MKLVLMCAALLAALGATGCNRSAEAAVQPALPTLAPGKWRIDETVNGEGWGPKDLCKRHKIAIEDLVEIGLFGSHDCSEDSLLRRSEKRVVHHSVCRYADFSATTDTTITGDLKTAYQIESIQKFDREVRGKMQQQVSIRAERIGDC